MDKSSIIPVDRLSILYKLYTRHLRRKIHISQDKKTPVIIPLIYITKYDGI